MTFRQLEIVVQNFHKLSSRVIEKLKHTLLKPFLSFQSKILRIFLMGPERAKSVEHRVLADVFCFFGLENRKNAECSLKTFFVSLRRFLHSLHVASVVSGRYVLRSGSQRVLRSAPQRGPRLRSGLSAPLCSRLHDPSLLTRRSVRSEKSWDPKKSFENKRFFCSLVRKKKVSKNS